MVARVNTVAFQGIDVVDVDVQVRIGAGLPAFSVVGLPDKAVAESRERVRGALAALGLALPHQPSSRAKPVGTPATIETDETETLIMSRRVDRIPNMAETAKPGRRRTAGSLKTTQVVGFRLPQTLVRDVKAEAAQRGMKLNELFAEMWGTYKNRRRIKASR